MKFGSKVYKFVIMFQKIWGRKKCCKKMKINRGICQQMSQNKQPKDTNIGWNMVPAVKLSLCRYDNQSVFLSYLSSAMEEPTNRHEKNPHCQCWHGLVAARWTWKSSDVCWKKSVVLVLLFLPKLIVYFQYFKFPKRLSTMTPNYMLQKFHSSTAKICKTFQIYFRLHFRKYNKKKLLLQGKLKSSFARDMFENSSE